MLQQSPSDQCTPTVDRSSSPVRLSLPLPYTDEEDGDGYLRVRTLKGVLVAEVEEVEVADMTALPPEVEEGGEDRGAGEEPTEQSPFVAEVLSVVAAVVMVTVEVDPDTSSWGRSGRRSLFSRFIDLASFNFCRLRKRQYHN